VDTDPSLSIDLDKGTWYCHGCAIGGGVVTFFQKIAQRDKRTVTRAEAFPYLRARYA